MSTISLLSVSLLSLAFSSSHSVAANVNVDLAEAEYPLYDFRHTGSLTPFSFTRGLQHATSFYNTNTNTNTNTNAFSIPPLPPTALFIDSTLDHFTATSSDTFAQMYFVNQAFVKQGTTPPFVHFILPQEVAYSYDPTLSDRLASTWGAISVTIEHRFYGHSIPGGPSGLTSLSALKYFTVEQAMEDFVEFKRNITAALNIDESIPWLLDGCSYSGAVSAWMKAAYPNLFIGAIAGSSVIEARLDFSEYVSAMSSQLPSSCQAYMLEARAAIENQILTAEGRQEIVSAYTVCTDNSGDPDDTDPLASPTHKFLFDAFLFNQVSQVVQYGSVSAIQSMCDSIMKNTTSPLWGFGSYISEYALSPPTAPCLYVNYEKAIPYIRTQRLDDTAFGWQQCTQLGYMQTTEGDDSVLPTYFNLTGYLRFCGDVFNDPLAPTPLPFSSSPSPSSLPRVSRFNDVHGSHGVQLTNTLFINGGQDPYHFLSNYLSSQLVGLSAAPSSLNGVLFYEGYPHCQYGANVTDLTNQYITKWLQTTN